MASAEFTFDTDWQKAADGATLSATTDVEVFGGFPYQTWITTNDTAPDLTVENAAPWREGAYATQILAGEQLWVRVTRIEDDAKVGSVLTGAAA